MESRPDLSRVLEPPSDDDSSLEPSPSIEWSDDVLEIVARLGEGAGGAVHAVRDARTGKCYARKSIVTRGSPLKYVLRELSIISTLEHSNITGFYGAYMSPSSSEVKVLMELCEGHSLEAAGAEIRRRQGRVGEKVAGRIAEGVLQGLTYLHSKHFIHRDIKPSNILLTRSGVVKLCDFGVSGKLVKSVAVTFMGTTCYMAPERILGCNYGIRADVWSTGLSILELVQNEFPYPRDLPAFELMLHISQSAPPKLEDDPMLPKPWSDAMKDFIRLSLTMDATARPTPRDLLLHPWIEGIQKRKINMARWISEVWGWDMIHKESSDSP
ncbi:kinase-like protein [Vararia minispora EC-137]|uniref:Kinase-like protein n=1 Tax=Vararia minispora EC-137 TaxID=1314806 RepID=A0ACB8QYG8_9AGAM|nr:kinase-like protein [Vararia minispora EC-137]